MTLSMKEEASTYFRENGSSGSVLVFVLDKSKLRGTILF